jgi:hypothetical protein
MIAFGISALFFAMLGVFVPLFGIYISGISGFLSWMSAGKGTPLGAAAVIINLINICFLSPGYMLVVGLEAQQRTPDQRISFAIWMFVLFLQISAIVVFLVNFTQYKIDFNALKKAFNKEKPKNQHPNRMEQEMENHQNTPVSDNMTSTANEEPEGSVSSLTKTLVYKIRGGKKPDSTFWKSEFGNDLRNLEDITFDGSRPHRAFLSQRNAQLKVVSIVISCIVLVFLLVSLRPDLFPFLKYSSVFNAFSKTFPENYLDRFKTKQSVQPATIVNGENTNTPPSSPSKNSSALDSQTGNAEKPSIADKSFMKHPEYVATNKEKSLNQNTTDRGYWYIIELQSGENIITQNAIETDGVIAALAYDGRERKFKRDEVKSVKKTLF